MLIIVIRTVWITVISIQTAVITYMHRHIWYRHDSILTSPGKTSYMRICLQRVCSTGVDSSIDDDVLVLLRYVSRSQCRQDASWWRRVEFNKVRVGWKNNTRCLERKQCVAGVHSSLRQMAEIWRESRLLWGDVCSKAFGRLRVN